MFIVTTIAHQCSLSPELLLKLALQLIEIYKIQSSDKDQKVLIKKLPYLKYISKFDDKWTFIENYWAKIITALLIDETAYNTHIYASRADLLTLLCH